MHEAHKVAMHLGPTSDKGVKAKIKSLVYSIVSGWCEFYKVTLLDSFFKPTVSFLRENASNVNKRGTLLKILWKKDTKNCWSVMLYILFPPQHNTHVGYTHTHCHSCAQAPFLSHKNASSCVVVVLDLPANWSWWQVVTHQKLCVDNYGKTFLLITAWSGGCRDLHRVTLFLIFFCLRLSISDMHLSITIDGVLLLCGNAVYRASINVKEELLFPIVSS